jgi:hypothetical protein
MFKAFDSVAPVAGGVIVRVPVEPLYVNSIFDVPVYVKFVAVDMLRTVAALPVTAILPVPNAMLRVLELLELHK